MWEFNKADLFAPDLKDAHPTTNSQKKGVVPNEYLITGFQNKGILREVLSFEQLSQPELDLESHPSKEPVAFSSGASSFFCARIILQSNRNLHLGYYGLLFSPQAEAVKTFSKSG